MSRRHGAVSEWRLVSEREVRLPRGGGREGGHTAGGERDLYIYIYLSLYTAGEEERELDVGEEKENSPFSFLMEWPAWILPGFTRESKYLRSEALSRNERSTWKHHREG